MTDARQASCVSASEAVEKPMKTVMTLLVRDEADIIDVNLRYHLARGVDEIVVTDNGSIDGTREILAKYASTGRVHVIDEPELNYAQSKWVTRMARIAFHELGATWVIHCDADEFWWPRSGDLKSTLASVPGAFGIVEAGVYDYLAARDEQPPVLDRMVVRRRHRDKLKVCHRGDPDVVVAPGNHRLHRSAFETWPDRGPLSVFHFAARTYSQFERKVVNGAEAFGRNPDLPEDAGIHWKLLYIEYRKGNLRSIYERRYVVDRRELLSGILRRRLTVDRRLQRFVATVSDEE